MDDGVKEPAPDSFPELLQFLENTSARITELMKGLSDSELRWRNSESEFSVVENACHLRDLEAQGYAPRITCMLDEIDPALADFDGARVAAESNYNCEQPELALQTFLLTRQQNVQKLRSLTEEQLRREGLLEGVGRTTLMRLAEMMREHDKGHLEDLRVLRNRIERRQQPAS
jgi:DinB superfamily